MRTEFRKKIPIGLDYDLWIEPRDSYIFAQLRTAVMMAGVYRKVFSEVRKAVNDKSARGLMFEYDTPHPITRDAIYELMRMLIKITSEIRIALVARHEMHWPALDFGAAFALETGREFKSFANPAAAEKWLLAT